MNFRDVGISDGLTKKDSMHIDDDLPTVEEAYTSANQSSNLRVVADKRGDADIIIAAGWSASRIGAALMRLHTEYDGASIAPNETGKATVYLLQIRLTTLPVVWHQIERQAALWGFGEPKLLALSVIAHWLDKNCPACTGRKFQLIPGTPSLSCKHCKRCFGSGESRTPHGEAGKKLLVWMDDCVNCAQRSIKGRLRNIQNNA